MGHSVVHEITCTGCGLQFNYGAGSTEGSMIWDCNMKLKVAKQTVQIARRNGRGSLGKCSSKEEVEYITSIPY